MRRDAETKGVSFTIRRATAADSADISALFHRSFTATFGHIYPPEDLAGFLAGCPPERFHGEVLSADYAVFVGVDPSGALLGYCTLGPQELGIPTEGRWWVLRQLYLDEAAKGSGLAQALMRHAFAEARARDVESLYLTVWVENHRARRFYDSLGFEEVGSYAFVVGDTVDDDRILRLKL